MNFEKALEALKEGKLVTRENWNGKGMYITHSTNLNVKVYDDEDFAEDNTCYFYEDKVGVITGDEGVYKLERFILMKTADNKLVPWLASQTDMLAEDWMII
jgi:hypothetical protein